MAEQHSITTVVGADHRVTVHMPQWPVGASVEVVLQTPSSERPIAPPTEAAAPLVSDARLAAIRGALDRLRAYPLDTTSTADREQELQMDRDSWDR